MKVLVCGSRYWKDKELVFNTLDEYHALAGITEIIEGCANGGDHCGELWAWNNNILLRHFPAQWDKYGKSAGPIRNNQMLVEGNPDVAFAFHDRLFESRGTGDMVHKLEKNNIPVFVVKHEKPYFECIQ